MRRLIIRIADRNRTVKVKCRPGTTSKDVLTHLELPGFVLAPADDPSHEYLPGADLFRDTRDGQRLIARLSTEEADRYILSFFKEEGSA